jgi:hypothetical protein
MPGMAASLPLELLRNPGFFLHRSRIAPLARPRRDPSGLSGGFAGCMLKVFGG